MNVQQTSRSPHLLHRDRSQLLIVDIQEKLLPVIPHSARLLEITDFLLTVAELMDVPVFVSEQYPKGLGPTVSQVTAHTADIRVFEKLRFSAAEGFLQLRSKVESAAEACDQVVIVGIEAHICVLQTALDLLSADKQVFVVQDAVGSRNLLDQQTALDRIRDAGGTVCTAESVAFEWCEVAGTEQFKQISRLVRERNAGRTP